MNKLFILLALFPVFTHSQQITWGEVSPEEMKMEYCDFDSLAKAMVLYDHIVYKYEAYEEDLKQISERHIRIKVFTENTNSIMDLTSASIFFISKEDNEKIIDFQAQTYNYNIKGDLEISPLDRSDIYKEEYKKKEYTFIKAALSNVRKGSVFEIKYKLVSNYDIDINDWYFQYSYPVKYSEFEAFIPQFYQFTVLLDNTKTIDVKEEKPYDQRIPWSVLSAIHSEKSLNVQGKHLRFAKKNVPSLAEEPYINSMDDYYVRLLFQITSYKFPEGKLHKLATNWDELEKYLTDRDIFKHALHLKSSPAIRKKTDELIGNVNDPLLKIQNIQKFVAANFKWNNTYSIWQRHTPAEIFSSKLGNSMEINAILITMLREAGINCYPALTSEKTNGTIQSVHPFLNQFNHVVCYVALDSTELVLDATHPYLPFGVLPEDLINQKAWVLSKPHKWIDLKGYRDSKFMSIITATLNENGDLSGKMDLQFTGYYAARYRKKILDGEELKKIFDSFIPDGSITACNSSNDSLTDLPLKVSLMFEINQYLEKQGDILTARAIPSKFIQNNPLSSETRLYPIHFEHSKDFVNIVNISLPNNFSVSELPEASSLVFPDNSGNFTFKCSAKANAIQTILKYKIQNEKYEAASYHVLRKLFLTAMQKQNSVLVVKKNE